MNIPDSRLKSSIQQFESREGRMPLWEEILRMKYCSQQVLTVDNSSIYFSCKLCLPSEGPCNAYQGKCPRLIQAFDKPNSLSALSQPK